MRPTRLTVLAKLQEDEFMCLSIKDSDLYVRFSLEWEFGMRVETTSNTFLDKVEQLDDTQIANLIAAGWNHPTWTPADPVDLLMNGVEIPISTAERLQPNTFSATRCLPSSSDSVTSPIAHRGQNQGSKKTAETDAIFENVRRISAEHCGYSIKSSRQFLLEGDAHGGAAAGYTIRERYKGLRQRKNRTRTTAATLPCFTLVGYNNLS